jgi:hypothetical protein
VKHKELEKRIRGVLRLAVIGFSISVPLMYAIVYWMWSTRPVESEVYWPGLFAFPVIAPALVLGGMWITSRSDLKRSRERE